MNQPPAPSERFGPEYIEDLKATPSEKRDTEVRDAHGNFLGQRASAVGARLHDAAIGSPATSDQYEAHQPARVRRTTMTSQRDKQVAKVDAQIARANGIQEKAMADLKDLTQLRTYSHTHEGLIRAAVLAEREVIEWLIHLKRESGFSDTEIISAIRARSKEPT